jgi:hypothetical protein
MSFRDRGRIGVASMLVASALCGCGSSVGSGGSHAAAGGSVSASSESTAGTRAQGATTPAQAAHPTRTNVPKLRQASVPLAGSPVGTAQHVDTGGAQLTVRIVRLIDPLSGSGAALAPGTRAAGVLVEIANAGPAAYDSSATGDFALVVPAGAVTPVFAPHGGCQTPLQDFDNDITAGEHRSGCVAFAVPSGARIVGILFSPHASPQGRLAWRASR